VRKEEKGSGKRKKEEGGEGNIMSYRLWLSGKFKKSWEVYIREEVGVCFFI